MNKIILNIGLIFFFMSLIFFGQRNLPATDVLFRSFIIFASATIMLSIIAIIFMRSITKTSLQKSRELTNKDRK